MTTPITLSCVSWSPNTQAENVIVVTSLKIPAMDSGTEPERWMILLVRTHSNIAVDAQVFARYHGEGKTTREDNDPDRC